MGMSEQPLLKPIKKLVWWKDKWHNVEYAPVVRCKDCRYYEPPEDGDSLGVCRNHRLCVSNMGEVYPYENYYCPYGERKDNERKAD